MKPNPSLFLIKPDATAPPRKLGEHGLALWNAIQATYKVDDVVGIELLAHACATQDRIEKLRAAIDRDGEVIQGQFGPKPHPALNAELAGRVFIARTFEKLGFNFEPIRPMGRPPKTYG
jgi:hypothetical protein